MDEGPGLPEMNAMTESAANRVTDDKSRYGKDKG